MNDARVLVVDDSAAMRALFADVLEQTKGVSVVGLAKDADDAREQIEELRPNVLTLDVEMPGMSGIEFLEELMSSRPMPVVMLSSLTQSGADTSLKAFDLGAVDCFPKPLKATPEQFAKTVSKLGKIVLSAANSNVRKAVRQTAAVANQEHSFVWNGHYVALGASMGGIDALTWLFARYPENCPPTVAALQAEPALVESLIAKLDRDLPCNVKAAKDGAALQPGTIHIAYDPAQHVVFQPGDPATIRLVDRAPVDGARPSATLLFGTIARGEVPAIGAVLSGDGEDGAKGLKLMLDAGCHTLVQSPESATIGVAPRAAMAAGGSGKALDIEALADEIIRLSDQG